MTMTSRSRVIPFPRVPLLTYGQGEASDLQRVRRRCEAQIEIDGALQAGHHLTVEAPHAFGRPHDTDVDSAPAEPSHHAPALRHPLLPLQHRAHAPDVD